jgi:RNA polymerase sigma-70 factor (ECF subfamily)
VRQLDTQDVAKAPAAPVAFDEVYVAHAAMVMRWAQRLGGPQVDPEDVMQEVFVVVNRRLREFRGQAKLTTWLFRITERVIKSSRRKQRLHSWLSGGTSELERHAGSATGPGPMELVERRQQAEQVYRILDRLPDRYRKVLVLFELEELSTEEIAGLLGTKIGTVRVLLHRARSRFVDLQAKYEASARGTGAEVTP